MQIKLNELLSVNRKASNRLLNVEDLSEAELRSLHQFFGVLAERISESHSIEEAEELQQDKVEEQQKRGQSSHLAN